MIMILIIMIIIMIIVMIIMIIIMILIIMIIEFKHRKIINEIIISEWNIEFVNSFIYSFIH